MSRTRPRQKRSRERVQKILLAAADELARTADADALTTTSVAKRSGIPVATVYRYFADRSAIISALMDDEAALVNAAVVERLRALERVTIEALLDTMVRAHYGALTASRRSIVLWFGGRKSKVVLGRVERRYRYLGEWLTTGCKRAGLIVPDAPDFGGEMVVWMIDRAFEFSLREDRSDEAIELILATTVQMMSRSIDEYSTDLARDGINQERFWAAFGSLNPPTGPLKK